MEKGKVKKIMEKTTAANKPFKSVLIDDTWYSSFDANINKVLCEGETIEFDYEENGKFKNLTKLAQSTMNNIPPPYIPEKTEEIFIAPKQLPDKDLRITRLAVLNTATEIHKIGNLDGFDNKTLQESIKKLAEELEKWVAR